jgi:hypothetical protein
MFFARTQKEHDWASPKYRFTDAQQQAWDRLIEEASHISDEGKESSRDKGEEEEQGENEEDEGVEEEDDEDMEEEDDVDVDVEEEDETDQVKSKPLTGIQRACLDFCVELLNHTISWHEYDSALVCALAVLGVKEDGWKGPDQYPPILSSMIKIARFMVVQKALEIAGPDGGEDDESNNDRPCDFEHPAPVRVPVGREYKNCLQWVTRMLDAFMVRGSHSPMEWMLDLRTYGLKIHYNTTAVGHIGWHGHDEILYKNVQFNMSQFRSMVHGLVEQCRQMMQEELLFCGSKYEGEKMPKVPWKLIRDNPTDERPGWNFLQDQRTRMPVDGQTWLFHRIRRDDTIKRRFSRVDSQSGVNQESVRAYMEQVVRFQEKLLVLMHITGGQLARAPEILGIRHSNARDGSYRNIFVKDGMVVFVTRYHKGYQISGDVKIIHRYLSQEVGELYVRYLWLVLPFQREIGVLVGEKEPYEPYMWAKSWNGKEWTSERMRQVLKKATMVGLGQELTIQAYREIAIRISRRFIRGSTVFQQEEEEEKDGEGPIGENPLAEIADS